MIELNKIYNCDCRDLMKEIIGGGEQSRLYNHRPALRNRRRRA